MFDPSSPKNSTDLAGTFIIAGLYSVILYIIGYVIINGIMFIMKIIH